MLFNNKNKFKVFAASLGLAILPATAAFAGFNQGDDVTFNGKPLFKIPCGAEGFTAERRAWQAQDALDNALFLSQNPTPDSVEVVHQNGAYALKLGGQYIATADEGSAKAEGTNSMLLAERWAGALKEAINDTNNTQNYIASLKTPNELEGGKIRFERRIFAPEGTVLPVSFNQELNGTTLTPGECITGKVISNVPIGNYFIPANSVLLGTVVENGPGAYSVKLTSLCTPNGTEVPINAVVSNRACTISTAPHPVATIGIPANAATGTRIPATIAVGTGGVTQTAMILTKDNGCSIACGQPANVVLERVSSVAVVPGAGGM
jgi:hypothetical protein